ncbi:hypothetical protein NN561_002986 [Cricetulus griseus]
MAGCSVQSGRNYISQAPREYGIPARHLEARDYKSQHNLRSVFLTWAPVCRAGWEVGKAEREHCVGGTRVQWWEASGGTAPVTGRRRQKSAGRPADHGSLTTCRQALGGRDIGEEDRDSGADRSQDQRMAGEQKPSSSLLEQFILLAKGTSGSALTTLISQVLEAPGVYVFGELLELANVQELAEGANAAYLQLLNLFAYGTYPDYIANKESLPELSTAQQNKLKHLTIVSLASRMKVSNIKKTLKATASSSAQEMEQQLAERECPPHTEQRQPTKKMSKVKGLVSSRH